MGRLASSRGYGLNLSKEWEPTVSIIVPTYNESPVVEKKLRNLAEIDYPRDKVELIVVDSASSDGTQCKLGGPSGKWASRDLYWKKRSGEVRRPGSTQV